MVRLFTAGFKSDDIPVVETLRPMLDRWFFGGSDPARRMGLG